MTYPPVWGPLYHDTLMFFATHFPTSPSKDEQQEAVEYLKLFFKFVPCPSCSVHSRVYFNNNPPDTSSGAALVSWVVDMHNDINRQTGKKHDWTVVEALQAFKYRYFNNQLLLSHCDRQLGESCRRTSKQSLPYGPDSGNGGCAKTVPDEEEEDEEKTQQAECLGEKPKTESDGTRLVELAFVAATLLLFIVFCVLLLFTRVPRRSSPPAY